MSWACRRKYQLKLAPTARIIRLIKTSALTFSNTLTGCTPPCCSCVVVPSGCCVIWSASCAEHASSSAVLLVHLASRLDNLCGENHPELSGRLQVKGDVDLC